MTFFKATPLVLSVAFLGVAFSSSVKADAWDKKTTITFSGPVEIPGVHLKGYGVLPAGTYVFKVLDSGSDRHIVQISSKDGKTVYATILAIPNLRLKATDKTVMTFRERPAGEPEALRAWFYPGKEWGDEFVYPKARAIVLAKETNTPVLFVPDTVTPEVAEVVTPSHPVVIELRQAPVMALQPSGETVEVAQVVTQPVLVAQNDAPTLPTTGSDLPLIALVGMLALAGALAMGFARKQTL